MENMLNVEGHLNVFITKAAMVNLNKSVKHLSEDPMSIILAKVYKFRVK